MTSSPAPPAAPRVAIDVRMAGHSGVGTYIRGLVEGMRRVGIPADLHPLGLIGAPTAIARCPELDGTGPVVAFDAPIYSLREQLLFPEPTGTGLLHFPHYNVPRRVRCRFVVTIHDLIHLLMPEVLRTPVKRAVSDTIMRHAARHAVFILTVSEWSRRDIARHLSVSEDRIIVTPNAVAPSFQRPPDEEVARVRRELDLPARFLLAIGIHKPHKNFEFLVRCFAGWMKRRRGETPALVFCGPDPRRAAMLERLGSECGVPAGRLLVLPYLEHSQLPMLYAAAEALVFPSLYEGFGIPPLEAQRLGVPVLASCASCIPEVAGNGARYFDPRSERELSAALDSLMDDPAQTRRLVEAGRANEQRFSWEATAAATLDVYRRVLT